MAIRRRLSCFLVGLLSACSPPKANSPAKSAHDGGVVDAGPKGVQGLGSSDAGGRAADARVTGTLAPSGPRCLVSESTAQLDVTDTTKLDLLFVIDNSDSMADKQALLRAQFPHLITVLTSGDLDGDGTSDFPPAKDLHLGVVTSDMGLPGVAGISNCQGLGQDGILQHASPGQTSGCQPSYPPFLTFSAGVNLPAQTAQDFACVTQVGTFGCGFEHPLEAALKALWPSLDPMANQNGGRNRISFLADPSTGFGAFGHGDTDNAGFLRNDPVSGLSLIAVVVLSDEDDCSSSDTRAFTPPQYLDPNDPVVMEGMSVRCHYNQNALFPIERYVNGLKALRPGQENLVAFAAIVGVPADLTGSDALRTTNFGDATQRDRFYMNILSDARMQEVVDNRGTPDPSDDRLVPSCITDGTQASATDGRLGVADPPRRVAQVARGFGENGMVQSICATDYGPAFDAIVKTLAKRLGGACLPRTLARGDDGTVGCEVLWELPPPGIALPGTPTACGQPGFEFLLAPPSGVRPTSDRGGAVCKVAQLAVQTSGGAKAWVPTVVEGSTFSDGWFYDDFSDALQKGCMSGAMQRISFTSGAKPPSGVVAKLACATEQLSTQAGDGGACSGGPTSASESTVGAPCLPTLTPADGFSSAQVYLETASPDCVGGVCMVYRLQGDPSQGCIPTAPLGTTSGGKICSDPAEVGARVYCSCRCDAPDGYAACTCPTGYTCLDALDVSNPNLRGGYCVKNGTFVP